MARQLRAAAFAAALLVACLLAAAVPAARGRQDSSGLPAKHRKAKVFPGEVVIVYETGVTDLREATATVRAEVARALPGDARAAQALDARGLGPQARAALSSPFEFTWSTPFVRGARGGPLPGAMALVKLHRLLTSGRRREGDALTERVMGLIRAHPLVRSVFPHYEAEIDAVACGPDNDLNTQCTAASGSCCRASDGTCGDGADYCQGSCMLDWGKCAYTATPLPRRNVLNALKAPAMITTPQFMIESAAINPKTKKITTAYDAAKAHTVMVIDTGIGPHSDLTVVGCYLFTPQADNYVRDNKTDCYDNPSSHGTHVAGILASRNNGLGPWGILEGQKLFIGSVKVGDTERSVSTVGVLEALRYIIATSNADGIAVVNMSLGILAALVEQSARDLKAETCALTKTLSDDYGIVMVNSAGNHDAMFKTWTDNLASKWPAYCEELIVATAAGTCTAQTITPAAGSKYVGRRCTAHTLSNRISTTDGTDADKFRTIFAPGENIYSTMRLNTYGIKEGTSMAAPHVSGIAARCFASGDCRLGDGTQAAGLGALNTKTILDAFYERNKDKFYKWADDGTTIVEDGGRQNYYGVMAWAGHW